MGGGGILAVKSAGSEKTAGSSEAATMRSAPCVSSGFVRVGLGYRTYWLAVESA
jgi:hypothetical protein